MPTVVAYECPSYDRVAEFVAAALDRFAPPLAGKRIFVKPNILGPCKPEEHVTTHPTLVRAVVDYCRAHGAAEIVVGDNPGMTSYGTSEHAARVAGIIDAADGCYRNIAESPHVIRGATARMAELPIAQAVLDADVIINLPKMKTHVATGITGAVKNTFGHVIGAAKTQLHAAHAGPKEFAGAVLDVFAVRRPDVSILDAVYAMEGQGPAGGQPRFVGRVLASDDAVALDVVAASIMGFRVEEIPYLVEAGRRCLGETRRERIETVGPVSPVAGFRRPKLNLSVGTFVARWVCRLFVTQPHADRKTCVRCGACARQCPVNAITMNPYPTIDAAKCISCFCCHEFCRYKAMRLAPRVRFLQRLRGGGQTAAK